MGSLLIGFFAGITTHFEHDTSTDATLQTYMDYRGVRRVLAVITQGVVICMCVKKHFLFRFSKFFT